MSVTPPPPPPAPAAGARKSSGLRALVWLVVLGVLGAGGWYGYQYWQSRQEAATAEADKGAPADGKDKAAAADGKDKAKDGKGKGRRGGGVTPVVAAPARAAPLNVYLTGLGTVTPLRTVTVRSRVDGQLMRVHFEEGQMIRQGDLLAEIDPRPFQVARLQAEGQLARDQALLANARVDLARYRTLLGQDSIARQQVDAQEALVAQYEGIVRSDQAQLENARLQLAYSRIESPLSGRAGLRQVDPGNVVRSGDATGLVVISQVAPIAVTFTIPQDDLPAVLKRLEEADAVPVEAWDRDQKQRLATGRLAAVDNLVDTATGTVKLRARFANRDESLFPNQFVNVRMRLDTLQDAIVIPSAAVQRGAQGMFVYVVKEDQTVTARPVKLGPIDGPRVAISEGIAAGEMVVIDGIDRLREGAPVQITRRPDFKPGVDGTVGKKGPRRKPEGTPPDGAGKGPETGAAPGKGGEGAAPAGKGPEAKGAPKGDGDTRGAPARGAEEGAPRRGPPDGAAGFAGKGAPPEGSEGRRGPGRPPGAEGEGARERGAGMRGEGPPGEGARAPRGEGPGAGKGERARGERGEGEARKGPRGEGKGGEGKGRDAKGRDAPGGGPRLPEGEGSESFRVTDPTGAPLDAPRPSGARAGPPGEGETRKGPPRKQGERPPEGRSGPPRAPSERPQAPAQ